MSNPKRGYLATVPPAEQPSRGLTRTEFAQMYVLNRAGAATGYLTGQNEAAQGIAAFDELERAHVATLIPVNATVVTPQEDDPE